MPTIQMPSHPNHLNKKPLQSSILLKINSFPQNITPEPTYLRPPFPRTSAQIIQDPISTSIRQKGQYSARGNFGWSSGCEWTREGRQHESLHCFFRGKWDNVHKWQPIRLQQHKRLPDFHYNFQTSKTLWTSAFQKTYNKRIFYLLNGSKIPIPKFTHSSVPSDLNPTAQPHWLLSNTPLLLPPVPGLRT